MVQNMMHLAVTHHTAAEVVFNRADAEQPHMGLTTWKKHLTDEYKSRTQL